jgi:hypothetical protein
MATVSPRARYHSHVAEGESLSRAQSPQGMPAIAAFYRKLVETGCYLLEHDVERMAIGQDVLTTEGELSKAYPAQILGAMGIAVPSPDGLYLYRQRLLIVWGFDEQGLVLGENRYGGGGPGFEAIGERPIRPEEIYRMA